MLNDSGRRAVVTAWQERKQEEITHPLLMPDTRGCEVRQHGIFRATDFEGPLVV
jgi:hypothetical protein